VGTHCSWKCCKSGPTNLKQGLDAHSGPHPHVLGRLRRRRPPSWSLRIGRAHHRSALQFTLSCIGKRGFRGIRAARVRGTDIVYETVRPQRTNCRGRFALPPELSGAEGAASEVLATDASRSRAFPPDPQLGRVMARLRCASLEGTSEHVFACIAIIIYPIRP
jgi:hypothetical protein